MCVAGEEGFMLTKRFNLWTMTVTFPESSIVAVY